MNQKQIDIFYFVGTCFVVISFIVILYAIKNEILLSLIFSILTFISSNILLHITKIIDHKNKLKKHNNNLDICPICGSKKLKLIIPEEWFSTISIKCKHCNYDSKKYDQKSINIERNLKLLNKV